jgi:hypothetical protein
VQGDQRLTKGESLRIEYTGFARTKVVVASGQIYGALPRILNVINAHMPPGEQLAMPGLVGDPDPVQLTRVPAPVEDLHGSLQAHADLVQCHPADADLLLDTFALACKAGDRPTALAMLERWEKLPGAQADSPPVLDPPHLTPELLRRMLPNGTP